MDLDAEFDRAMFVDLARQVARMRDPVIVFHPRTPADRVLHIVGEMGRVCPAFAARQIPQQINEFLFDPGEIYFIDRAEFFSFRGLGR